jgi:hypothetical protein
MINRLCIGLGNAGATIVREIADRSILDDVKLYAIDSTTTNATIHTTRDVNYLCTISDEDQGSGRDRERGAAMYRYHESNGDFDEMYSDAIDAKGPVILITSAAGGTGSGSIVPLCKTLLANGVDIIPVIVFPNQNDPIAYHLNANDLLIELGEVGIVTYSIFVNPANTADYTDINNEVVNLVEIVFGKKYHATTKDSIDDSDLKHILETPGRFIALSVKAPDTSRLKKEITRKVFSGYQPAWTDIQAKECTFMKAFGLTSMFAADDHTEVFSELNARIPNSYDEYKNVAEEDNDGVAEATVIIAGLPRHEVKEINTEFNEVKGISDGMTRSTRPKFMKRKKATITKPQSTEDGKPKFEWKE